MSSVPDAAADVLLERSTLWVERRGSAAIVWLNRPDRLNAFTYAMRDDMVAAFDVTDADDSVRAVVITGTGRAFCAGADLESGGDTFIPEDGLGDVPPDSGGTTSLRIFDSRKPVIAAVNGPSAGVGVTMTLPADVRIASEDAKFAFVFTRRGLVPEACSTWFLPRVVGIATALRWTMSGATVRVADALAAGLVSEVVPKAEVLARALEIAGEFTDGTAPVSVALTRAMMWQMSAADTPRLAHRVESRLLVERGRSGDVREGVASFLEKRSPVFADVVTDHAGDFDWDGVT
ncbi:enoyl-CoA hydratase-related protein [Gordonia sp. HY442]|uniref:enoyl-CoA hydratase-related protein n=1 Tax=Gordonia zhenghanii TaxID=2911516 RepID=UPI001F0140A2|nr:enoyl-CoA hydratase-related protein [Gordonia zhenghanii]MCF8601975.1 enoyl-CoA hydratase-related protein [Gordonia zhenghanii]MCF8602043.1 enoyl-CoA hydratase-related protein [Gordonia zhenghanii]